MKPLSSPSLHQLFNSLQVTKCINEARAQNVIYIKALISEMGSPRVRGHGIQGMLANWQQGTERAGRGLFLQLDACDHGSMRKP